MKLKSFLRALTIGEIALFVAISLIGCGSSVISSETSTNTETKANGKEVSFICRKGYHAASGERLPTTYARTSRGKIAVIRFKTQYFKGSGYDPLRRCEEIAPRFDKAYHNGSLKLLTNGRINSQPVICTTYEYNGGCETLLITLRPKDDPQKILIGLTDTLNGRQRGGVIHNSSGKQWYYRVDDIDKFLATAPVEKE